MNTHNRWTYNARNERRASIIRACAIGLVMGAVAYGGYSIGKRFAPETVKTETVTITETVEVPVKVTEIVEVPVVVTEIVEVESANLSDNTEVYLFDVPLSAYLQKYIYEICADKSVPVSLVMAMIERESQFNVEIVSSTKDYGLMQINEINHGWLDDKYRCDDMLNPYQNVFCGITILSGYIEKYGDLGKSLMAYNMGEYGAKKAWANGITSTKYSASILELMKKYEEVSNGAA